MKIAVIAIPQHWDDTKNHPHLMEIYRFPRLEKPKCPNNETIKRADVILKICVIFTKKLLFLAF